MIERRLEVGEDSLKLPAWIRSCFATEIAI